MSIPRSLPEILRKSNRGALSEVHTALPAKVVAYDGMKNLADLELQVDLSVWDDDGLRTYETVPVLPSVPVIWPRAGGFVVTLPLAVGDMVLVLFSETAIGEWRTTGQRSRPVDARRHSVGYPVCIPGFFPDVSPMASGDVAARAAGAVVGKDGAPQQVRCGAAFVEVGAPSVAFAARADNLSGLETALATLATSLTGAVSIANVNAAGTALTTALGALPPASATVAKVR